MKAFYTILLFACVSSVCAQPAYNEFPVPEIRKDKYKSSHMILGFDFLMMDNRALSLFLKSQNFIWGISYQKRLGRNFTHGFELLPVSLSWNTFRKDWSGLTNDTLAIQPGTNEKERYTSNGFGLNFYNRIILSRTGKKENLFIDMGAGINLPYYLRYVAINNLNGLKHKTIISGIGYRPYLSVFARAGFRSIVLNASWRFTGIFRKDAGFPDPPAFNAGIQLHFGGQNN